MLQWQNIWSSTTKIDSLRSLYETKTGSILLHYKSHAVSVDAEMHKYHWADFCKCDWRASFFLIDSEYLQLDTVTDCKKRYGILLPYLRWRKVTQSSVSTLNRVQNPYAVLRGKITFYTVQTFSHKRKVARLSTSMANVPINSIL